MGWYSSSPTSTSGSEVVVYVVQVRSQDFTTTGTADLRDLDPKVLLVEPYAGNYHSFPIPKVLTLEENRNLAAARAHAQLMAESVRAAPARRPRAPRALWRPEVLGAYLHEDALTG